MHRPQSIVKKSMIKYIETEDMNDKIAYCYFSLNGILLLSQACCEIVRLQACVSSAAQQQTHRLLSVLAERQATCHTAPE